MTQPKHSKPSPHSHAVRKITPKQRAGLISAVQKPRRDVFLRAYSPNRVVELKPVQEVDKMGQAAQDGAIDLGPKEPRGCRWIDGEPGRNHDWRFCQAPQKTLSSYCEMHHVICFIPAPKDTL